MAVATRTIRHTSPGIVKELENFNQANTLNISGLNKMPPLISFNAAFLTDECSRIMKANYYESPELRERLIQIVQKIAGE